MGAQFDPEAPVPNRLIHETSPYLLQHAHNPVEWYPWGPEALARARAENLPILLSIGYSACHWCHVMEHESFEDPDTAALMNQHFVNIKVDREERPDLDSIYMSAVQAMTGRGGWPMTMFLTPAGVPFYGGTYFPPADRGQMPSFRRVLESVAESYRTRAEDVRLNAERVLGVINRTMGQPGRRAELSAGLLDEAFANVKERYDATYGGFGGAPKFPQSMTLEFLLRVALRTGDPEALGMANHTLVNMARGGMYDQLGGGFHRYSVDAYWLAPHFEKMLYDNALLSRAYLHAYQFTRDPFFRRITEETLDYVEREMVSPEGGFYSTQDADSEGHEGKFYVWSFRELLDVLGPEDARIFAAYYGASEGGNFEGANILNVSRNPQAIADALGAPAQELEAVLSRCRPRLLHIRNQRVWPALDDKCITAWNGLMLRSFAEAAGALGRAGYRETAVRNAEFVASNLYREGRLLRTYRNGEAKLNAYLEDYAFLADGLLALYELTFDRRWFRTAIELAETMIRLFWDQENGGFFDTASDHEALISRPKEHTDNAIPAGNSVAAGVLLRLGRLTGRGDFEERARRILEQLADHLRQHPTAFSHLLCVLDDSLAPSQEIAIVGAMGDPATLDLLSVVWRAFLPHKVLALGAPEDAFSVQEIPLLEDRDQLNGRATAYVCENFACLLPVTDPAALAGQLEVDGRVQT